MTMPHTDCPACPKCGVHCGTTTTSVRWMTSVDELRCAACGHYWRATLAELAQAVRADAAWEAMQR